MTLLTKKHVNKDNSEKDNSEKQYIYIYMKRGTNEKRIIMNTLKKDMQEQEDPGKDKSEALQFWKGNI